MVLYKERDKTQAITALSHYYQNIQTIFKSSIKQNNKHST